MTGAQKRLHRDMARNLILGKGAYNKVTIGIWCGLWMVRKMARPEMEVKFWLGVGIRIRLRENT